MKLFAKFSNVIDDARERLKISRPVPPGMWQGVDVSSKPEMATYEILNHSFQVPLNGKTDLQYFRMEIKPNLPWADLHFLERVSGEPLNPGEQWKNWPYAKSADKFRDAKGQFTHTYMERYWPKTAGYSANFGIRYQLGDLEDVVKLLIQDPTTRQAYLPVWFPEDTGALHKGRLPCSLGYHFIMRHGWLHIVYYLRSCDFVRHFRDDIYLTLRLLLWVLEECCEGDSSWKKISPGMFTMHTTSLHFFKADYQPLFGAGSPV